MKLIDADGLRTQIGMLCTGINKIIRTYYGEDGNEYDVWCEVHEYLDDFINKQPTVHTYGTWINAMCDLPPKDDSGELYIVFTNKGIVTVARWCRKQTEYADDIWYWKNFDYSIIIAWMPKPESPKWK